MNKNSKIVALLTVILLLAGIFIKIYYIDYTETWERQHDVISFGAEEGQAAYIEYFLYNKQLPDFDPRTKWGFFQPPLHHIVSAFTISVSERFGAGEKRARENTQIPTCLYMIALTLMSAYVLLKSKGLFKVFSKDSNICSEGLLITLAVIGVHPMFIFFSGSINNDALALTLSLVALIIASVWYQNPNIILTVLMAIAIGLAMIAKLTGGLVAVPIGILMVLKVFGFDGGIRSDGHTKIKGIDRIRLFFKKYFVKMLLFSAVVFPLGLSYSIYNKLKWGMPFNYIPPVGERFPESVTMRNRLFDITTDSVYTKLISRGDAYDEYNVPLMIVKTSLFGEYSFADVSRWMKPLSMLLFISAVVLIIVALYATVYVTFGKNSKLSLKWKILLFGTYITYLVAYLYFALSSNNFSAQDFRYSAICIVCEGIFLGLFADSIKNSKIRFGISAVALCFAMSSFFMFTLLGIKAPVY